MISILAQLQNFLVDINTEPELAIHGIRKQTKFLRSLLRLAPDSPASLNEMMKTVSSIVAPYRDALVSLETYQTIVDASIALQDPELENKLRYNQHFLKRFPDSTDIERINTLVLDFSRQLDTTVFNPTGELIFLRVYKTFKSSTKMLNKVKMDPGSERVHTWRKKTKRLWYQLRFIFGDELQQLNHPLTSSNLLGKILGEIHDLDVFLTLLPPQSNPNLRDFVLDRRGQLLQEAIRQGDQLYLQWDSDLFHPLKQF